MAAQKGLMKPSQDTDNRKAPLSLNLGYAVAYMFLLLFMNMYGFWRPFSVNIFTFLNIAESLTNALLFVGDAVLFVLPFTVLLLVVIWVPLLVINVFRKSAITAHGLFTVLEPNSGVLKSCVALLLLMAALSSFFLQDPFRVSVFLSLSLLAGGLTTSALHLRGSAEGWGRSISTLVILILSVLPAFAYTRGAFAAYHIQAGCGDTRLSDHGVDKFELRDKKRLPVYLGHAGDNYIFYNDVEDEVFVLTVSNDIALTLVHSHGTRSHTRPDCTGFACNSTVSAFFELGNCKERIERIPGGRQSAWRL